MLIRLGVLLVVGLMCGPLAATTGQAAPVPDATIREPATAVTPQPTSLPSNPLPPPTPSEPTPSSVATSAPTADRSPIIAALPTTTASTPPSVQNSLRRFVDALVTTGIKAVADQRAAAESRSALGESAIRQLNIAVLPFQDHGAQSAKHDIGDLVTYEVRATLLGQWGLMLYEPAAIRAALQRLEVAGPLRAEQALEVGRALRADVCLTGNVSYQGDHFAIDASVLDPQGKVDPVWHRTLRVNVEPMIEFAEQHPILRTRTGALWRGAIWPAWGLWYTKEKTAAVSFGIAETALLAAAVVYWVRGHRAEAEYEWDLRESVDARPQAEDFYLNRNYLFLGAAGIHLVGALLAYLSGSNPDEIQALGLRSGSLAAMPLPITGSGAGAGGVALGWRIPF